MKTTQYMIIGSNGIKAVRKTKPQLNWDEIACKIQLDIPNEIFHRPQLEAVLRIDGDKIQSNQIHPEIIINTKDLIEQQTGAKIEMKVIEYVKEKKE